jgi:hypothetical protein
MRLFQRNKAGEKIMRTYLAILYTVLFVNFAVFADSVRVGDFEIEEFGTGAYLDVTITGYTGTGGELDIQRRIPGRPVTIIGRSVFAGKKITTVELPRTLTEIRGGAFRNNLLEAVELPASLSAVGEAAFSGNSLREIVLPPYTGTVGERAFAGNRITRLTIGADVDIGENAFDYGFRTLYESSGRNAGVYVCMAGRWYPESEWLETAKFWDASSAVPGFQGRDFSIYQLGDTGPAGGIVFYDTGDFSGDWRYLEAAPKDLDGEFLWSIPVIDATNRISGLKTGLGEGKFNTDKLISARRSQAPAAWACAEYRAGGSAGWFMPSRDELDLMYRNLKQKGLGNFQDRWYWSSSTANTDNEAWDQNFADGRQYGHEDIRRAYRVRAVRAF